MSATLNVGQWWSQEGQESRAGAARIEQRVAGAAALVQLALRLEAVGVEAPPRPVVEPEPLGERRVQVVRMGFAEPLDEVATS